MFEDHLYHLHMAMPGIAEVRLWLCRVGRGGRGSPKPVENPIASLRKVPSHIQEDKKTGLGLGGVKDPPDGTYHLAPWNTHVQDRVVSYVG